VNGFLLIAGLVVLAIVAAYLSYYFKRKRREALALMARQLGMEYSPQDQVGCLNYPFALLAKGEGRGTENVVWGTWQGIHMTEFDYWYYEESTNSKGHRSRTYYRFSCAVTEIAAQCAHLSLDREGVLTRLADHLGLHDIEFESDDFNRRFNVKCSDRKFANDLVDSRMMQWLLGVDGTFQFEVSGTWVLCYSSRLRPVDLVPLLGSAKQFVGHVPHVVFELYGTGADR
jgi:hypothetical protein